MKKLVTGLFIISLSGIKLTYADVSSFEIDLIYSGSFIANNYSTITLNSSQSNVSIGKPGSSTNAVTYNLSNQPGSKWVNILLFDPNNIITTQPVATISFIDSFGDDVSYPISYTPSDNPIIVGNPIGASPQLSAYSSYGQGTVQLNASLENSPPPGPYIQQCSNITYDGHNLTASCPLDPVLLPRTLITSTINYDTLCVSGVGVMNGVLKCTDYSSIADAVPQLANITQGCSINQISNQVPATITGYCSRGIYYPPASYSFTFENPQGGQYGTPCYTYLEATGIGTLYPGLECHIY